MKFVAVIEYIQDQEKVAKIRPLHRQYLSTLRDQGKIVASGPFTDGWGALIIYETASQEEAETLVHDDPFRQNGVFLNIDLRPWNPVLSNRELL